MPSLRFNVDFEEVLSGKPPRPHLIATLEFFAFWVTHERVLVHRDYSSRYLEYVSALTDHKIEITKNDAAIDWWGETANLSLMRELSSKTEFLKWWLKRWPLEAAVCESPQMLEKAIGEGWYLIKKSDGMSGRGHIKIKRDDLTAVSRLDWKTPVVVEPLYDRVADVSALWIAEESRYIYYQNIIDQRFQWRGSILNSATFNKVPEGTGSWSENLSDLQKDIFARGYQGSFSVDAFFYMKDGQRVFHPGSEMNPRKTMGWLAYQLWKKEKTQFFKLAMHPCVLKSEDWMRVSQSSSARLLSPEDNMFVWYFVTGSNIEELQKREADFLKALLNCPT
ncbi:MAG: hypothetical protein ACLGG0_02065 [Bacteriovoracia bacterium]